MAAGPSAPCSIGSNAAAAGVQVVCLSKGSVLADLSRVVEFRMIGNRWFRSFALRDFWSQ